MIASASDYAAVSSNASTSNVVVVSPSLERTVSPYKFAPFLMPTTTTTSCGSVVPLVELFSSSCASASGLELSPKQKPLRGNVEPKVVSLSCGVASDNKVDVDSAAIDFDDDKDKTLELRDESLTPPIDGDGANSGDETMDSKRLRPKRGQYR